jgi:TfoX N-terminal domain
MLSHRPGTTTRESRCLMDRDFLVDLFADFGPVTIRPMFSGFGISVDGVNFALSLRAGLYFRADEQTIPRFEAEGQSPFSIRPAKGPSSSPPIGNCRRGCSTTPKNSARGRGRRSPQPSAPR